MGGLPRALSLLAHSILPLDHWSLFRLQRQVQGESITDGFELLCASARDGRIEAPLRLPIAIPHASLLLVRSGDVRAGSIEPLRMQELASIDVALREMRHPNIPKIPNCLGRLTVDSLTEESEFEAKASTLLGTKIPRVIPPFGLKLRMVEMVPRELELVTGNGQAVCVVRRLRTHRQP